MIFLCYLTANREDSPWVEAKASSQELYLVEWMVNRKNLSYLTDKKSKKFFTPVRIARPEIIIENNKFILEIKHS